jgi:vacuolar protein sorting-associated protein 54
MRDAELFDSKLSKIDGAGDLGSHILNLVKEKQVENALTSQPSRPTTTNGTESMESSSREAPRTSRDAD